MRRSGALEILVKPHMLALTILAVLLAGCATTRTDATIAHPGPRLDDRQIVHLLSRMTFGPRPADVARVRAMGVDAYLETQLFPSQLDDTTTERALESLPTLGLPLAVLLHDYPRPDPAVLAKIRNGEVSRREAMAMLPPETRPIRIVTEMQAAKMLRAIESERQLEEVMVDFWFNHFNVFAGKGEVRWYVGTYEREAIRPHALGRFRDLLAATARHPAMLFYLDNWLSAAPDFTIPAGPARGRKSGLNENYARELMELHTLGVDGGYTQQDVTEVARAFTGWTIDRPRVDPQFVFRPRMHDDGEKVVLGHRIPAGGGETDGERVIDILVRHPSTARFIATKLARRFVADDPPPPLVARVASTFTATDGDIRAMLRTIFTSPEFYAAPLRHAKVKTPFELVASAVRALDGHADVRAAQQLARAVGEMGERLYQATSPTGHADRAEAWVSAASLLARMNFALALSAGRYPGLRLGLDKLAPGVDRSTPRQTLDRLLAVILHDDVTPETRAVLTQQVAITDANDTRTGSSADRDRLAALVLGSPEFQRK